MKGVLKRFYVETEFETSIRWGHSAGEIKRLIVRKHGTADCIVLVREATEKDIAWVKSLGSHPG